MYRTIEDFQKIWQYESESTLKTFKMLTDSSLTFKVSENVRTLGFMAWHIVLTLGEMGGHMGLQVDATQENAEEPKRACEIVSAYEKASKSLAEAVSQWNDEKLFEFVEMYGERWQRGDALRALVHHEIHHRAQMTVLMRQAGIKIFGIYGPAKEEWAQLGMAEQK